MTFDLGMTLTSRSFIMKVTELLAMVYTFPMSIFVKIGEKLRSQWLKY